MSNCYEKFSGESNISWGDHSVSYATVKAFSKLNENSGLIIFDAHADLMPSTASPVHEDWLRMLIEKKILDASKVIIVGIRNVDENEQEFIEDHKINVYSTKEIFSEGVKEISYSLMELARNWPALYVSIDIDVCDPAFAPAVAYPEPGGLSSRELLHFIQGLKLLRNFKAADIIEVMPEKDINHITVKLAAKILSELNS
ncbi:MAG: arginase family protein [Nanoarchaeota archaeon]